MTDFLSQNDIDQLLNSNLGVDDSSASPESADSGIMGDSPGLNTPANKVYKLKREIRPSFDYRYQSPVFKSNDIVINPDSKDVQNGKPVVRTLNNYVLFKKKQDNNKR